MIEQPIDVETRISAPPEVVFAYFVDPDLYRRWKGTTAELDARPGGLYQVLMPSGDRVRGEYVAVEPPHRVVFTWGFENNPQIPPGSSTVSITLTADHRGTRVRLVHTGLPHPAIAPHHHGWAGYLAQLAGTTARP